MVICLEQGADLHMAQLMPLPLTVSCSSKIQIGFTFLVLAHLVVADIGPLNGCVCVSMPVDFCRHLVGKTLTDVCHRDSAWIRFVGKSVIMRTFS